MGPASNGVIDEERFRTENLRGHISPTDRPAPRGIRSDPRPLSPRRRRSAPSPSSGTWPRSRFHRPTGRRLEVFGLTPAPPLSRPPSLRPVAVVGHVATQSPLELTSVPLRIAMIMELTTHILELAMTPHGAHDNPGAAMTTSMEIGIVILDIAIRAAARKERGSYCAARLVVPILVVSIVAFGW